MFGKAKKIKGLEKKISSALGIITNTIDTLEKTNEEFDKVRVELETEMEVARGHHMSVLDTMAQNRKVAENFKKLLK